ncbi:MAG: protein-glutamine gamma-glutamyltransferase [Gorillibacterium sp.]|nr:protein-glutamine gamma-glutamyltransferase [Gorillibacterium sp.]
MILFADGSAPISPAKLTPPERMIYELKSASPVPFKYETPSSLLFELRLRANILESARLLSRSGARFATFAKSTSNPWFWTRTPKGAFVLRNNVMSSEGIRDIYLNGSLYAFECATAMVIVLYRAILETVGDAVFNQRFADLTLYDWNYDQDLFLQRIDPSKGVFPGDIVYFENPDVSPETPWWIGENTVKMDNYYYFGHGIGIVPSEQIIATLNRNRRLGSMISAFISNIVVAPGYRAMEKWVNGLDVPNNIWRLETDGVLLSESLLTTRIGHTVYHRFLA